MKLTTTMKRDFSKAAATAALAAALTLAAAGEASAQGLAWNSYAEIGAGVALAGGVARPIVAFDAGIELGGLELGTYIAALPLEFGGTDLIQAGAVHYGGTVGAAFGDAGGVRPFGRIGVGGTVRERADEQGGFDGEDADTYFSVSFTAGVELPLGGRWALRPWAAFRFCPDGVDYAGGSLSGPDLGLSLRAVWETTIR